jgi:transcriptional regulator with XRE-family HTH domain
MTSKSTESERRQIGRRFAAARKRRRMTQAQVAEAAGLSLGVINNLENGRSLPQAANRDAIVRVIGEDVFGGELADAARAAWPRDVQVFTDVLGAHLAALSPEKADDLIRRWMAEILSERQ